MAESKQIKPIPKIVNDIATTVLEAAFSVHTSLGPGLLESVYEACMIYELRKKAIQSRTRLPYPYTIRMWI
jgi:GxxExxY protein